MLKSIITLTAALILAAGISTANDFKVDTDASKVKWHAEKVTGEHDGTVKMKSGSIEYTNGTVSGGNFVVDLTTIANTDIDDPEYKQKLENHLKSDDFFGVKEYPEASFKIKKVTKDGSKHKVTGNMTIRGITHEVSFPADIKVNGNKLTANAEITLDRSKYEVKFRSKSFFDPKKLGDKLIYDEFKIYLDLVATK